MKETVQGKQEVRDLCCRPAARKWDKIKMFIIIFCTHKKADLLAVYMNYAAIPFLSIPDTEGNGGVAAINLEGDGGIAVNYDASLISSVNAEQHCVRIYSVNDAAVCAVGPVIVGTVGMAGSADGQLYNPLYSCFAHRKGIDTLLICDCGNSRVVEVSVTGEFLRAIAVAARSWPLGIAYCGIGDVIAVSLFAARAVVLLQYECGTAKPEVTIGSGTGAWGRGDGELGIPKGVTFTADGRYILVAGYGNDRVSKFSAANGAFIAHVATKAADGISCPSDVIQWEDGSFIVAHGHGPHANVVRVGEEGEAAQNIMIPIIPGHCFYPFSLFYSAALNGVVVKTVERSGKVLLFLLRDAWMASSRSAWISALSTP
jgi:hypothetical protein